MTNKPVVDAVQEKYAAVARSALSGDSEGVRRVAEAFGYSPEELESLPAEANMGLSCGNPVATAKLRPGEVVVDLGSGGGIDVLLASRKVGPSGKAIGIDMTPEMIARARANAVKFGEGTAPENVEFHLSTIDKMPLADGSVDCVISNCVINLAPDKASVFREMYRVAKPGGRVAVSDIALKRPLPREVGEDLLAYVGCIAGALLITDYERMLRDAGFETVQVIDTKKNLNAYSEAGASGCCAAPEESCCTISASGGCSTEPLHDELAKLLSRYDVNDYAASVQVYAVKSGYAA
jgi:ubiquinone/menaquinone biosynthesis C-methylase UbiE